MSYFPETVAMLPFLLLDAVFFALYSQVSYLYFCNSVEEDARDNLGSDLEGVYKNLRTLFS